jgi:hypothetical protein
MSQGSDNDSTLKKLLDFAEFFVSLGDMKQSEMLMAVAERDPGFGEYFETADVQLDTALDFFRIYTEWAIKQIQKECADPWDEIIGAYMRSEKWDVLNTQCGGTVLWDLLQKILSNDKEEA